MRLLIKNNQVIGTADEGYTGSTPSIPAPADFDIARFSDYIVSGETAALPPPPPPPTLAQLKAAAILKIDADADKIYGDVVGNKGEEYRSAEADAKTFAAAGFTGTVPPGVQSWATAKAWTATQAANDILTQATAWRTAQNAVRANRLGKKEAVRAAVDAAALNTVMAQWAGFVNGLRGQLGV